MQWFGVVMFVCVFELRATNATLIWGLSCEHACALLAAQEVGDEIISYGCARSMCASNTHNTILKCVFGVRANKQENNMNNNNIISLNHDTPVYRTMVNCWYHTKHTDPSLYSLRSHRSHRYHRNQPRHNSQQYGVFQWVHQLCIHVFIFQSPNVVKKNTIIKQVIIPRFEITDGIYYERCSQSHNTMFLTIQLETPIQEYLPLCSKQNVLCTTYHSFPNH